MRRSMFWAMVALVVTSSVACSSLPTGQLIQAEGRQPTFAEAEALILKQLSRSLRDPESMKAFKVVSGPDLMTGTNLARNYEKAWLVCVEYNAKNAYGAYAGLKSEAFPMRFAGDDLFVVSTINWISADRSC